MVDTVALHVTTVAFAAKEIKSSTAQIISGIIV